jgi:hypothetical protein
MGGDATVVRELEVELALATRKLDAGSNYSSVGPGSGGVGDSSVILSTKLVHAIDAAVHLCGHLFRSAKAQHSQGISVTHQSTTTPISIRAMLTAAMLRLIAQSPVLDDVLSAARASRS